MEKEGGREGGREERVGLSPPERVACFYDLRDEIKLVIT